MTGYLREVCSRLPGAARSLVVAVAVFFAASWAAPALLGPAARDEPQTSPVDRLYAEHRCAHSWTRQEQSMLLISTPAGGPELIPAAATVDELGAQTDWLYDQRADFYGWCER